MAYDDQEGKEEREEGEPNDLSPLDFKSHDIFFPLNCFFWVSFTTLAYQMTVIL